MNKELIDGVAWSKDLDVVILGDATVEEWNGRWLGKENDKLSAIKGYFKKTFSVPGGGEVNGLALGIAGDTVSIFGVVSSCRSHRFNSHDHHV
jgi:hypothetical protein